MFLAASGSHRRALQDESQVNSFHQLPKLQGFRKRQPFHQLEPCCILVIFIRFIRCLVVVVRLHLTHSQFEMCVRLRPRLILG